MTDRAKLRFTEHARHDLYEIFAFIAQDSPTNASQFIEKLENCGEIRYLFQCNHRRS
ncbi:MAG: type II toxin-antitoxin system RelE/ParE family toxin [Nitrospirae bacterium]|nr:type II toxin-antitoxin system RelE/ParE family toxin [Magnetococcales bacterium]